MILMGLSKAFDCFLHDLMTAKFTTYAGYGMSHSTIKLLVNYLRHCKHVKISSEVSEWMTLLKGIPQESILRACLFNLFLNDFMCYYLLNMSLELALLSTKVKVEYHSPATANDIGLFDSTCG